MSEPQGQPVPNPGEDNALPSVVPPPLLPIAASPAAQSPPRYVPPAHLVTGRRYGFLCGYCSSRLEAVDSLAGQSGTCPTCGNAIVIPILDHRGRLIDPATNQIIKQDPHPVHAYAAAGHRAPQIVAVGESPERHIKCPRCSRLNSIAANNCQGCGLPFTMDGTTGDAISGTNTFAVASLVLGIVGVMGGFCLVAVPPILAIIFGFVAMRRANYGSASGSGRGIAIAGLILGVVGVIFEVLFIALNIR